MAWVVAAAGVAVGGVAVGVLRSMGTMRFLVDSGGTTSENSPKTSSSCLCVGPCP